MLFTLLAKIIMGVEGGGGTHKKGWGETFKNERDSSIRTPYGKLKIVRNEKLWLGAPPLPPPHEL